MTTVVLSCYRSDGNLSDLKQICVKHERFTLRLMLNTFAPSCLNLESFVTLIAKGAPLVASLNLCHRSVKV